VRERLTLIRLFEELQALGMTADMMLGGYARDWSREQASAWAEAYVLLSFGPVSLGLGAACQFDWSHEIVLINGVTTTVNVAHVCLCHSRMMFVRSHLSARDAGDGV